MSGLMIPIVVVILFILSGFRIIMEYERGVIFRFGRFSNVKTAGIKWIIPIVDRMIKISLRTVAMDVPPQDVITRDNVSVKVNAVIYFRVIDAERAIIQVEDFLYATSQLAQTTLRSILGQHELDDLLAERDKINKQLQTILDKHTDPWGIKISLVEVKHIDLPQEMQRAMAKQAEAERERRSKIINAEGEFQASAKIAEASEILSKNPVSLQLRYLQTLAEIATENNSTTIFPIPIDFLKAFMPKEK